MYKMLWELGLLWINFFPGRIRVLTGREGVGVEPRRVFWVKEGDQWVKGERGYGAGTCLLKREGTWHRGCNQDLECCT